MVLAPLWFLPALFLAGVGFVVKYFAFLPMSLDIAFAMQMFLLAGILIRRHKVLDKMDFKLCGALILILLGVFYFNETIDINTRIYENPLMFYAGGRR